MPGLHALPAKNRARTIRIWIVAPARRPVRRVAFAVAERPAAAARSGRAAFRGQGRAGGNRLRHHGRAPSMKEMPDRCCPASIAAATPPGDVTYSRRGCGAAKEGTVLGIQSFSLSQAYASRTPAHSAIGDRDQICARAGSAACSRAVCTARRAGERQFPDCLRRRGSPTSPNHQNKRDQELLRIDARHDGRGNPYYWIAFGRGGIAGAAPGSDLAALNDKRIAISPVRLGA